MAMDNTCIRGFIFFPQGAQGVLVFARWGGGVQSLFSETLLWEISNFEFYFPRWSLNNDNYKDSFSYIFFYFDFGLRSKNHSNPVLELILIFTY